MEMGRAAFHDRSYLDALEHYRTAYQLAEGAGPSPELRGQLLTTIGACLLGMNEYKAALAQFLQARPHTIRGGNQDHLAALDANIGSIYFHQGDLENAARMYRRAFDWVRGNRSSPKWGPSLANLGLIELRLRRYGRALEHLEPALRHVQAAGDRHSEAAIYDLVGLTMLGRKHFARAEEAFQRGLEVRRGMGASANLALSLMYLGRLELERGRPQAAMEKFDQAITQARQRDDRRVHWASLHLRSRVHRRLGQREPAVGDLRGSVEIIESLRTNVVPTDGLRVHFQVSHHEVYAELAALLGEAYFAEGKKEAAAEAFHVVELGRAQSLRALVHSRQAGEAEPTTWRLYADRLRRLEETRARGAAAGPESTRQWGRLLAEQEAELREFEARLRAEDPVLSSGLFAPSLELGQTQREVLDPDSLLLNFHLTETAAYLWAVTDSEARFYRLPPPGQWRGTIGQFVRALEERAGESAELGRRLYQTLLAQVEPSLLERRHWIIAAGGDLVSLPFCALPAPPPAGGGSGARYLVERHSFSYTPSASVLHSLSRRESPHYKSDFLAVADPVVNRADERWEKAPAALEPADWLARLVSSQAEARACARLFAPGRSSLLTGFDASEGALRRLARSPHRYWHFSSHVVVDSERPNNSFLLLSIPRNGVRAERLTVFDILGLSLGAEMVTLNGCDSGAGKNLPGEGVMSLARAFLAAGARSVCATRWKIPDEGGALVRQLYRHLLAEGETGINRAEALRQAQIEMIRAGDWRSDPGYWAAYFLVGAHRAGGAHG